MNISETYTVNIPERADALAAVCVKHFPSVDGDRCYGEAVAADSDIRSELRRMAVTKRCKVRPAEVTFHGQSKRSAVIRRAIAAINRGDRWSWRKARNEFDGEMQSVEAEAIADVTGGVAGMRSFGDLAIDFLGPTPKSKTSDAAFWVNRRRSLELCLERLPNGRPSHTARIEALRVIVTLWEVLGGKRAQQPAKEDGTSERVGPLVDFLADAVQVYRDEGLHRAAPGNSGAAWQKILGRRNRGVSGADT